MCTSFRLISFCLYICSHIKQEIKHLVLCGTESKWQESEVAKRGLKCTVVHTSSSSVFNHDLIFILVCFCEHQYIKTNVQFLGIVGINSSTQDSSFLA